MTHYPAYVQRLLDQARDEGQWYCGQYDAAARCYEVLALFPEHQEAAALIYELFCDPWLIYDARVALQQQIEEWDDRPWQQRRRMALSFRFMSRWEGWHREYEEGHEQERSGPPDVAELLDEGKGQLLHAYCLGDEACSDFAWPLFTESITRTNGPRAAMLWVGKGYADMGFFPDAAEVLATLCARFDDADARRLLAEVRWWRDNAHRLPWLPPPGDGTRYWRMMTFVDPDAPGDTDVLEELRARAAARGEPAPRPLLDADVARLLASALPEPSALPDSAPALVDWSFLDADDGQPGEPPPWAKRMLELFPGDMGEDMARQYRWTRAIQPPATPRRYDPDEPPLDEDDDAWLEDDDWLDEEDDLS